MGDGGPNKTSLVEAAKRAASTKAKDKGSLQSATMAELVVVLTTISIATLKVFDIVRTMTAGNFNTSVVANEMYTQAFRASEVGRGSALALILFVMVLPIVIYNVNVLRKQREIR